jgi:hypothetical protein
VTPGALKYGARSRADVARLLSACLLSAFILLGQNALAAPVDAPLIDVYTMGPGADLFSRFGHAAICVTDSDSPAGRCYNYGTADFSTPGPLTFGIVRGSAWFWVSVVPLSRMLAFYAAEDRTVYRQRMPYDGPTARSVATTLHAADVRSATFYHYHHFKDNCTTRIRDLLDLVAGHALSDSTTATDPPLREYVERGLAGEPALLAVSQLVLGRAIDRPSTRWQGMFLPAVLRNELIRQFHAPAEVVYERRASLPAGSTRAGSFMLIGIGAGLALFVWLAARLGRPRLGLGLAGFFLGAVGLVVAGLACCSPLPELRYNEVVLVFWPTDVLLPFLSRRVASNSLARYLRLRLLVLLACALGAAVGVLIQPLLGSLLLCAFPLLAGFLSRAAGEAHRALPE